MDNIEKRVICPYCGYRLPLKFSGNAEVHNLHVMCKGRNCKREFNLIVSRGIQRNGYPNDDIIAAFQTVFGEDYKEHIRDKFGVYL